MKLRNLFMAGLVAAAAVPVSAQPAAGTTTYGKVELNLFGGASYFKRQDHRPFFDLGRGSAFGFRLTQNYWNYVGLEEAVTVHGVNNATFSRPNSFNTVSFGARQRQVMLNPVFHFTGRDSNLRPFVTAGPGFNWYIPTDDAKNAALRADGSGLGAPVALKTQFAPMFNYGAGIKGKFGERVGVRTDVRGFFSQGVTLGVPDGGPDPNRITFSERSPLQSVQFTAGLVFYMGKLTEEPIGEFRAGAIESSVTTACPGDTLTFRAPVTNTMAGVTSKFKWTVNGQDQPSTSETLTIQAPAQPGNLAVRVAVDADTSVATRNVQRYVRKNPIAATARDTTVVVKAYNPPTVTASASPTSIGPNGTATLTATPNLSECSGDVTYTWEVDGGALSGTGATRTLSAAGLNLACGTRRTLTARVTVRDAKGATANASVPVEVVAEPCPAPPPPPAPPELRATQFDDVLFTQGGDRVNNCGKRTLDRVYEQAMASNDYDVLLVGHLDTSETSIRRRANQRALDRARVENAAAYLTSGEQPCKRFDRNRVKIAIVGDAQNSPLRTALCEASVQERSSSRIGARDDRAKFRRVEVWLVPREGKGQMPAGISGIETAPQVQACPK